MRCGDPSAMLSNWKSASRQTYSFPLPRPRTPRKTHFVGWGFSLARLMVRRAGRRGWQRGPGASEPFRLGRGRGGHFGTSKPLRLTQAGQGISKAQSARYVLHVQMLPVPWHRRQDCRSRGADGVRLSGGLSLRLPFGRTSEAARDAIRLPGSTLRSNAQASEPVGPGPPSDSTTCSDASAFDAP